MRPEQIEAFRQPGLTLEEADAWLTELLAGRDGRASAHSSGP